MADDPGILVLGAGLVTRPLVGYLLDKGYRVSVADLEPDKATAILGGHPRGRAFGLDMADEAALGRHVAASDLTVSLVPFQFHPRVARHCIRHRKPMVTASYVAPEMAALDADARAAGVTILNEIGVDPGIDHMSAMRIIDDVRARGGRVVSFRSYCGGLPAPEANTNPFGYKFSWAPRGVLLASRNGARYRLGGRLVEIPPERLFRDMHVLTVPGAGDFEAYPNRDSLQYIDVYGLEGIETMYRATLRNMGWCDTLYCLRKIGLLELDETDVAGQTWAGFVRALLGAHPDADLRVAAAERMGVPPDALPPWNLHWLGMLAEEPIGAERLSPLDALGRRMVEKLVYAAGERDMLVMLHDLVAAFEGGRRREHITSRMVDFGIPGGDTSMSRTVSLPAAIAADLILTGRLATPGVLRPVTADIYDPVLAELERLGIGFEEQTEAF